MAKQRRNNSIVSAIKAVTTAVRAEADGNLTSEERSQVINNAMDIVDDSSFVTIGENADEAIELQHQIEEKIEDEQAEQDVEQVKQTDNGIGAPEIE